AKRTPPGRCREPSGTSQRVRLGSPDLPGGTAGAGPFSLDRGGVSRYPVGWFKVRGRGSPREGTAMPRRALSLLLLVCLLLPDRPAAVGGEPAPTGPARPPGLRARTDRHGDPLPEGAIARFGTSRLRHVAPVLSLAFSPDGKRLASGSRDGTVAVWDVATGK